MLSGLKKLPVYETLMHSKDYLSIALANEGLKFISIPILTYLLSTAEYGILNIFGSWVSILSILFVFNLNGAISRYYYEYTKDFGYFLGYSLLLALATFVASAAIMISNRAYFAELFELPEPVIWFLIVAILFETINLSFRQVFQPRKETKRIKKYSIGAVYITFALTVLLILLRQEDKYIGRLQAMIAVGGIYSFFKLRDIFKFVKLGFRSRYFHYISRFSLPNIPYLLSGVIISQFDRIMINNELGNSEAGLYSFAYNIGTLQLMISNAIHNAWTPKYFEAMYSNSHISIVRDGKLFSKLIALGASFLILYGMEIGKLLSAEAYHASLGVIPWIVIGHFFVGVSPFSKNAILYKKKTYITALMTLGAGVVNVLLNLYFIPLYGGIAAAYTTLVTYMLLFLTEYLVVKYLLNLVIIPMKTFLLPLAAIVGVALVDQLVFSHMEWSILMLFYKLFILFTIGLILFYKQIIQLRN